MIKASIVGGTGYTGAELLRLLLSHPDVQLIEVSSRREAGRELTDVLPHLVDTHGLRFTPTVTDQKVDLVFFATPHGVAMHEVGKWLDASVKIIDLSADFRLRSLKAWRQAYGVEHACPELLETAVYGVPEIYRNAIRDASLVANPGCYPTSILLGMAPLLQHKAVTSTTLIADCKSGVSGAGKSANAAFLLAEMDGNFKPYKASGHRHHPETLAQIEQLSGRSMELSFTPHLLPFPRGILSSLYFSTDLNQTELQKMYEAAYRDEPFVRVMPAGSHPETRLVRGLNDCLLAIHKQPHDTTAKIFVAIDNLVKGAAGQAVQNMNLMFGFDEQAGLRAGAVLP